MPPAGQKLNERALLDAACGADCVVKCPESQEPGQDTEAPQELVAHYEGSFRCPGKLESIVSLFPCGDAMGMHGIAGTVTLMQATKPAGKAKRPPRWESAGEVENTVLSGKCKVARVAKRDVLVCLPGWGPLQGITGESLCVLRWTKGLGMECVLRVEDNCMAGGEDAFAAQVTSWSVGAPAADGTVPVSVKIKRDACEGQPSQTVEVEAVVLLDAAGARLDPQSAARLKKVPVSIE
jgi:hypothetical protein